MRDVLLANKLDELPVDSTDWFYRNLVPKDIEGNLKFREMVLDMCYSKQKHIDEVKMICSRDILFYINVFGWTINPKEYPDHPLRPFVTYGYQDRGFLELQQSIGHEDIALPKTRDMGASWMCLLSLEHRWHFRRNQLFLLTSEKEELVDGKSEKALFKKLDFWWDHLPSFLVPEMERVSKHAKNLETGSAFDGEATVENMATGDRRTAIMMDETSKMPNAEKIFTSTRDVTRCRLFNSTPNGRFGTGEPFYRRVRNKHLKKIFMHWSEHPEKSRGLYKLKDGVRTELKYGEYDWTQDYSFESMTFFGDDKPRSEWYDEQCRRAGSSKEIAQELDIDFLGSSERFGDERLLMRVRNDYCAAPVTTGRVTVDPSDGKVSWANVPNGPFKLWLKLNDKNQPPVGHYSVGVDTATGSGGDNASESGLVVFDRFKKEQVAEFASRTLTPEQWAVMAWGVCLWFHNAFMVPESNGATNAQFIKKLKELGYPNVYRKEVEGEQSQKDTKKIGYANMDGGAQILGALQDAIGRGEARIRSDKIIDQFLEYEWKSGRLVHAASEYADSESGKGKTHGDIAIASALGWLGVKRRPVEPEEEEKPKPGPGTVGYRLAQMEEELSRQNANSTMFVFG